MENLIWVMVLLGLSLLFGVLEIFVPSFGFLTVSACAALAGSVWVAFYVGPTFGLIYLTGILIATPIVVTVVLRTIPQTSLGKKVFLETEPTPPEEADPLRRTFRELIGRTGRAVSLMMPAGRVEIDGKSYDALSDLGAVDPGTEVIVLRSEQATLIVRPTTESEKKEKIATSEPVSTQKIIDPFA